MMQRLIFNFLFSNNVDRYFKIYYFNYGMWSYSKISRSFLDHTFVKYALYDDISETIIDIDKRISDFEIRSGTGSINIPFTPIRVKKLWAIFNPMLVYVAYASLVSRGDWNVNIVVGYTC